MPCKKNGRVYQIDPVEADRWRKDHVKNKSNDGNTLSLINEQARVAKISADRKEFDFEIEKGNYFEKRAIEEAWVRKLTVFKTRIQSIPKAFTDEICDHVISFIKEKTKKELTEKELKVLRVDISGKLKSETNGALTDLSNHADSTVRKSNKAGSGKAKSAGSSKRRGKKNNSTAARPKSKRIGGKRKSGCT